MRNIYLIARRDYLGYVTSWGFWLGILLLPLIIGGSAVLPTMIRDNQPVRFYTVIEEGTAYRDLIAQTLEERRIYSVRRQLEGLLNERPEGFNPESVETFKQAVIDGADLQGALDAIDPGVILNIPDEDWVYVDPPVNDPEALTPYLLGETLLPGSGGRSLFAAIIESEYPDPNTGEIKPVLLYTSSNVTNEDLASAVRSAARESGRLALYDSVGLTQREVDAAEKAAIDVQKVKVGATGEASAVTFADRAPFFAAVAIVFVLWFMVFSMVQYLLAGTIEERGNKIFDTLLTSASLRQLLIGKLLAVFALTLTLMGSWALGAFVISNALNAELPAMAGQVIGAIGASVIDPAILVPTIISFILGYLIFGALFLALGSLCETVQESQTLISPLLIVLMIPMFMLVMAIENPTSPILAALSWVPFLTPFLLILRLPNELPLWEISALIGLMAVTTVLILWAAMKVYRAGAVHGAGVDSVGHWLKSLIPGMGSAKKAD